MAYLVLSKYCRYAFIMSLVRRILSLLTLTITCSTKADSHPMSILQVESCKHLRVSVCNLMDNVLLEFYASAVAVELQAVTF